MKFRIRLSGCAEDKAVKLGYKWKWLVIDFSLFTVYYLALTPYYVVSMGI